MPHDLPPILKEVEEHGFCVVPDVLVGAELTRVQKAFEGAIDESRRRGLITYDPRLDPNDRNIRVNNLPDMDPIFIELLRHPLALEIARRLVGASALVSNFSANVSYPGAASMMVHADQALIAPSPWNEPWVINIIWSLDDMHAENGATLYLPNSHRIATPDQIPADPIPLMKPFIAPAGSFIVMEGRLWHTSGVNRTKDERRALLFALYSREFLRQQMNWEALLSPETKAALDAEDRALLGLGPLNNTYGAQYVMRPGYTIESADALTPQGAK
jgi:fumagillin biosynthesis dioxygenase